MKKFVVRLERAVLKVALSPELRPVERDIASRAARSLLLRFGAGTAVSALVLDLVARYLG